MLMNATLLYAGTLGMLLIVLSFNVTYHWVRITASGVQPDAQMHRAERVLASFAEYVPFALLLMGLIELRGAPKDVIHGMGAMLVASRLLHAFAANEVRGAYLMRAIGAQLTYILLMIASLGCVYYFAFGAL